MSVEFPMKRSIYVLLLGVVLLLVTVPMGSSESAVKPASAQGVETVLIPSVLNNFDASLGTSVFGVQTYGNTSSSSNYFSALINSGTSWARVPIAWSSVESTNVSPDAFNWSSADRALAAAWADTGGLEMIATIDSAPGWAAAYPNGPINPGYLDDFAEFVGALVERYDGDGLNDAPGSPAVTHWEFYNEPDNNASQLPVHWGDDGDKYAEMLKTIYPVVKAASPQAKVVFGGIAFDGFEKDGGSFVLNFLTDVLDAGGGQYFDVMNFHYYPAFRLAWTTSQGTGLPEKTKFIRDVLGSYGISKPVMITEAGWHSNNAPDHPSNDEIQARYVVELFVQSMANDVQVMIWWTLYDVGGFYPYDNGLVTYAEPPLLPTEKPSFYAFQRATAKLGTAHYVRALTLAETGDSNVETYQFNDNVHGRTVYVAWLNPIETNNVQFLSLPAAQATVIDSINGATSTISDGDDGVADGKVTVQISNRPVYVEISK